MKIFFSLILLSALWSGGSIQTVYAVCAAPSFDPNTPCIETQDTTVSPFTPNGNVTYPSQTNPNGLREVAVESPKNFAEFLNLLNGLIGILIPFIFALTFLTITWGVIRGWVMGEGSSDDIEQGKKIVFVGVVALVVMSSIWGILSLLKASLFGA